MPARCLSALRSKAALGPRRGLVSAVMMVPSSSSIAAVATPDFSSRSFAATVVFLSAVLIFDFFISSDSLLTSASEAFPSAKLQSAA